MEEEGGDEGEEEVDGNICLWHQFGHCKFGPRCPDRHVVEVCSTEGCQGVCRLRHPPTCRYFLTFGRCKFGPGCSFQHIDKQKCSFEKDSTDEKIKLLEDRVKELEFELSVMKEKQVVKTEMFSDLNLGQPGDVKGDEELCPRLRDGERVIAHQTNTICVPSLTTKMSVDKVLESILESKVFQDYVDKKVMVKTDQLEETINRFKKQTERCRDTTRKCVINNDDDITILWGLGVGGLGQINTK